MLHNISCGDRIRGNFIRKLGVNQQDIRLDGGAFPTSPASVKIQEGPFQNTYFTPFLPLKTPFKMIYSLLLFPVCFLGALQGVRPILMTFDLFRIPRSKKDDAQG